MKKNYFSTVLLLFSLSLTAQVGIGTTNPNTSSMLDIESTDKGLLVPRVALVATNIAAPVVTPATSLLVYNTATFGDVTPGYYYWGGTSWVRLQSGNSSDWTTTGNIGINPAINFIGTTTAADFITRTNNIERMRITPAGNVGIGVTNPAYSLELNSTFGYGNGTAGSYRSRTETKDNAGALGTQSGFFETTAPVNFPTGASSWWHLIDTRHSNNTNIYALQIAGSFFDQELWFRKTNGSATQSWSRLLSTSNFNTHGWSLFGNSGTTPSFNYIGTSDNVDFVTRTGSIERMRITNTGNIGIGTPIPTQRLDVQGGNARISSSFVGDVGHGAGYAGFAHSLNANTTGYSLLCTSDGQYTFVNKSNTNSGYIGFRVGNIDAAVINNAGNMGIGTTTPYPTSRLQVSNGSIMPQTGNSAAAGIYFTPNPGGGGGDEAYIRHYVEAGENTKLVIANINDGDDDITLKTGPAASDRLVVNGQGTVYVNRAILFDCNDCGSTTVYDIADGAGGNWGDLVIQGRVLSTNSNLHISPPGGSRVIINSSYRSAGGGIGTTGLDIEDGGIRFRKNYRWINRYGSTGGFGWGSQTHNLGNWDFCAVGGFGFRNTNAATDEDDDVQCSVYPQAHADPGEANQWDSFFTYQFNQRPVWFMYLEGYADTNATNCAAMCMNFD